MIIVKVADATGKTPVTKRSRPQRNLKPAAMADPDSQIFLDWLRIGLAKSGKSLSGLARAIKRAAPQARKIVDGKRRILAAELRAISEYIEEPIPVIGGARVPVICHVGNGLWYERSVLDGGGHDESASVPAVPSTRYGGMPQYAAHMLDATMDRAIEKNAFAICVPFADARAAGPLNGDIVLCEIRKSHVYKPCILRMVADGARWELQTYTVSGNHRHQTTIWRLEKDMISGRDAGDEDIDIHGLVIAKFALLAS